MNREKVCITADDVSPGIDGLLEGAADPMLNYNPLRGNHRGRVR